MKRIAIFLFIPVLLLSLAFPGLAADFTLDESAIFSGMNDRSWARGYQPTVKGNTMTICLPIASDKAVGPITAELVMADDRVSPFKLQAMAATEKREDGLYRVKLSLSLYPDRVNGDYPGILRLTGKDAEGSPLSADLPILIPIRDGLPNNEVLSPVFSQEEARLNLGEDGSVSVTLTNPSATQAMTDLILTMTEDSGDLLMAGSDKLSLPALLPGESRRVELPVWVKPDAAVSVHSAVFTLTYRVLGEARTWTERLTLPVRQTIRLEQGGVQMGTSVVQGDLATLTLPLMNLGRGDLRNVAVSLTIDDLVSRQTVLVGTIAPGETKDARLTFTPDAAGSYTGTVTAQCEDDYGNTASLELPVNLTVEPPVAADGGQEPETEKSLPRWILPTLGTLLILALLGLIVQGALLGGKIRRMEEDKL